MKLFIIKNFETSIEGDKGYIKVTGDLDSEQSGEALLPPGPVDRHSWASQGWGVRIGDCHVNIKRL